MKVEKEIRKMLEEKKEMRNDIFKYQSNPRVSHKSILEKIQTEINLLNDILEVEG